MLNYFVMAYPDRVQNFMGPGDANPIYASLVPELGLTFAEQGRFLWTKSASGYPWDIKAFDTHSIYDRTTELSWTDPRSFKRFDRDLPMSQRCAPLGQPGKVIKITPSGATYSFYASCKPYRKGQLGYVFNTVTAPVVVNTKGNVGLVKTRYFKYHYGCNSAYSGCTDMEVFALGYQIGLHDWKHYVSQHGRWVMKQESIINNFSIGQTTPYLPCKSSFH